ncbi:MAG: TIGR04197 family type VII secretion effector [Lachnospiraceae bacterium]|nr:TIGR04197 family type VII secretion effector [Lachnospiraceae bacterium]
MSDTGTFKSSEEDAQSNAIAITGAVDGFTSSVAIGGGETNLTFMNNLEGLAGKWSSCNDEFKDLLANDSDKIMDLQQYFDEFDAETASRMEGN